MNLGLSMWSCAALWRQETLDIPAFIRLAAQWGADGVELLDFFWRDQDAEMPLVMDALRETGLPVCVYSVSNNFALPDPAARADELAAITAGVDCAVSLGASIVRVFAGNAPEGVDPNDAFRWITQGLSEAADYALNANVTLALENHGRLAGLSGQVSLILDAVSSPALRANPDTGNFLLVQDVPENACGRLAPRTAMAHLKDFVAVPPNYHLDAYVAVNGSKYAGTALGEGDVDLPACLARLRAGGFDGWVNIEYEAQEDPLTGVPRSVVNARRLMQNR